MSKRQQRQPAQPVQWMNQPFTPHEPGYNPELEPGPLRTGLIWLAASHPRSVFFSILSVLILGGIGAIIAAVAFSIALLY